MQYLRTEWKDGTADIIAVLNPNPPSMYFSYFGSTVANIGQNGDLNIKGSLHEECDPKLMVCSHDKNDVGGVWANPLCFYNGERVWALLGQDVNSPLGVQFPLCFWNETDFFVWGKLKTNVPGPESQMVFFEPILMDDGGTYSQMGIRGNLVSEITKQIEP